MLWLVDGDDDLEEGNREHNVQLIALSTPHSSAVMILDPLMDERKCSHKSHVHICHPALARYKHPNLRVNARSEDSKLRPLTLCTSAALWIDFDFTRAGLAFFTKEDDFNSQIVSVASAVRRR